MKQTAIVVEDSKMQGPEVTQTESKKSVSSLKRILIVSVIFLVVAGVVAGSVFLGVAMTRETIRVGYVSFNSEDGFNRERLTIYNEQEGGARVKGQYQVIVDYSRDLLFLRLFKEEIHQCLVIPFNSSMLPSIEQLGIFLNDAEVEISSQTLISITVTTITANPNIFSENAQKMCSNKQAMWALPSYSDMTHKGLQKRNSVKGDVTFWGITFTFDFSW